MSLNKSGPIDANVANPRRGGASFPLSNRFKRLLWNFVWFAFASWTPNVMWRWRCVLLKLFGAKLSKRCDVQGGAKIWLPENLAMEDGALIARGAVCYNQAMISLGRSALVSQGAHLCAGSHDIFDPNFQLIVKPIGIGDEAWVAAEAFVGPGSVLGEGAVLGARAVCFGKLEPWTVYVGNPCKPISQRRH
jgi:putative colanic acid biosynthesis acetyltransferase WcaF